MARDLLQFSNIPVYEPSSAEYHRPGGPMSGTRLGIRTRPWHFTEAYASIMEAFRLSALAGLASDVRVDINLDGVICMWGEIEMPRHG